MGEIQFLKGLENNLPSLNKRNPEYFYITTDSGKLILGENVWQSNISLESVILESARTDTNYVLYMNSKEIFSVPIVIWDVETDLIGCSLSSNNKSYSKLTEVEHGSSFSANVIPYSDNHTFKECKILVGGIDKTSECFDETNMVITIDKIKGNVSIYINFEESAEIVGHINENNEIYLYENKLPNGVYTLYYEDENDNILDSFGTITDEATI